MALIARHSFLPPAFLTPSKDNRMDVDYLVRQKLRGVLKVIMSMVVHQTEQQFEKEDGKDAFWDTDYEKTSFSSSGPARCWLGLHVLLFQPNCVFVECAGQTILFQPTWWCKSDTETRVLICYFWLLCGDTVKRKPTVWAAKSAASRAGLASCAAKCQTKDKIGIKSFAAVQTEELFKLSEIKSSYFTHVHVSQ